ncbi:Oidioi.mRNA.OKI2018_I69.chr1.g3577.t1.cds [Oikopleura dioica]|uniref:Oidioi.mRNA.OKI2018_I69.chr1.g3577.t1.cds n=1 Tax=Oikopleura dioica TaxID=34765 RepID=A0ABN7T1D0_OIKDI|nr:Oidioi.mRNA.OKI2018_I69.chr1.g3577.t1.cds [Oikopleura dioica]
MILLYLFLTNFAFGKLSLQDRNKNPCVVSLRSESEVLFEKSCEIKAGDVANFFIDEMAVADAEKIKEVKLRSDFLNSILFQAPIKQINLENKENLQIRISKGYAPISDFYASYDNMYDADLDAGKKEFEDWEYNTGKTVANVSIWASRTIIVVILVFVILLMYALSKLFNFMNEKGPGYSPI